MVGTLGVPTGGRVTSSYFWSFLGSLPSQMHIGQNAAALMNSKQCSFISPFISSSEAFAIEVIYSTGTSDNREPLKAPLGMTQSKIAGQLAGFSSM